ncbi:MAG: O-antigen ligase family protein [Candidatus Cloacimonetes bacterium]|nr:O-antigen ligase family protein [Candidatus Cloacimonadota bacterium]
MIALLNPFERLGSFWVTAMTINGFYTVAFFFAITLALYHKSRLKKLVNAICALLILLGMLYTYTRMAILAVAFGIFLLMLRLKVMRYLGLALMLLMPLLIPSSMSSRIQLGFTYDVSLVIRALAWYLAITQIIRFPLTGMGFSVWSTWYAKVIPLPMLYAQHTHNLFLNLMIDMGIIGTGAFLYLIFIPMHRYYRRFIKGSQDILSFGFWVSMMALLFACITDIFIQQYSISILFWVSLGLMISLNSSPQNEPLRKQL